MSANADITSFAKFASFFPAHTKINLICFIFCYAPLSLLQFILFSCRLNNSAWLEKHPQEAVDLKNQLQQLNDRLLGNDDTASSTSTSSSRFFPHTPSKSEAPDTETTTEQELTTKPSSTASIATSTNTSSSSSKVSTTKEDLEPPKKKKSNNDNKSIKFPKNPIAGFDEPDLVAYLPVGTY